ncbi:GDSL-type esterase/lipase family protein [Nocardia spumae]|uniref:GDSL-type esterase/lipase family protein n=1 Tax=Nocardia spumae TaxID=2887190 RepID=UPI001D15C359|nr:GDSL-type esterase/lipase family protein [Nocardia spumae]
MVGDVRVCFVGDSLVAGVGDRGCLGWAGRLAGRAAAAGVPLTYYNLGVRRQTSSDIAARWEAECAQRLTAGTDARVVFSFGINDTLWENGAVRVPVEESAANLRRLLRRSAELGWTVLVVAPPPCADAEHNSRTVELDDRFTEICDRERVSYLRIHQPLRHNDIWMRELRAGDGYHPDAPGYEQIASLIGPHWLRWLSEPGTRLPVVS